MDRAHALFGGGGGVGLPDHALVSEWLWRFGVALAVAAVGFWISKLLSRAIDRLLLRVGVEQTLRDFLRGLAHAIGVVVVAVAALDALGVPTTSLLAVLGAAGLAIGLALKDSLSNIASGVMLIVLRPFRAGDTVLVAGTEGVVEQVRIFQTVLRTAQNHDVYLPNSQVTSAPIVNYTARPRRRVDVAIAVGGEADLALARRTLIAAATANPRVLADPAPDVAVARLGDSRVDLELHAWVATADHAAARSELAEAASAGLAAAGLKSPAPWRDLGLAARDAPPA